MGNKNFDLVKFLQQPKLMTSLDYSGIEIPNIDNVHQIAQNFEDWRKSQGFKTEEEKQEELKKEMKDAQQRFNEQDLWNSEDPYEVYNVYQTDPKKQKEFAEAGAKTTGILSSIPLTIASAGATGWIPTIITTGTGVAGGYGGQKLGQAIDKKYGTNVTPALTIMGGILGGVGGYKGLVQAGSTGLLKNTSNGLLYSQQFAKDAGSAALNRQLKQFAKTGIADNLGESTAIVQSYVAPKPESKKIIYEWYQRPSKLTSSEVAGDPKHVRNNVVQQHAYDDVTPQRLFTSKRPIMEDSAFQKEMQKYA